MNTHIVSFSYSDSEKQEVSMHINGTRSKKQGGFFKCNSIYSKLCYKTSVTIDIFFGYKTGVTIYSRLQN
ncbi:HORMA domain [Trifolium repens]|nr:HORMA domain [Trifolium repens]